MLPHQPQHQGTGIQLAQPQETLAPILPTQGHLESNCNSCTKTIFCFLSTHRKKLLVVNITHFTHSMGHRSPVLGHPTPAFVVLFWYTSAWLVQQLFSINSLKSVIDSGVHWKVSHWESQIICMGKKTVKQKMLCVIVLLVLVLLRGQGFVQSPNAPVDQQHVVTPALHAHIKERTFTQRMEQAWY